VGAIVGIGGTPRFQPRKEGIAVGEKTILVWTTRKGKRRNEITIPQKTGDCETGELEGTRHYPKDQKRARKQMRNTLNPENNTKLAKRGYSTVFHKGLPTCKGRGKVFNTKFC